MSRYDHLFFLSCRKFALTWYQILQLEINICHSRQRWWWGQDHAHNGVFISIKFSFEFIFIFVVDVFTTRKKDLSVIPEASQESANTSVYPLNVLTQLRNNKKVSVMFVFIMMVINHFRNYCETFYPCFPQ